MKIVCIAASFVPSKTANSVQVVKASHALSESGHNVVLLVPGGGGVSWDELQNLYGLRQKLTIRWIPENLTFKRYDYAFKAVQAARRLKPDLIYTWVLQAGVLALWQGTPVILELHDRVTGRFGPWLLNRFIKARPNRRILTNTHALKRILCSEFQMTGPEFDMIVSPNGVDLERYQALPTPEEARNILGLQEGFTAGYTGHFYAGRGMSLMFELAKAMPQINLLWVGGQQEDVAVWEERQKKDRVMNLTLTGFVDNARLPQYQAASDILLMPYEKKVSGSGGGNSAEIASPMKMFEYMAAGRAILSSDLPVIREVLDETTAVFCPPDDLTTWQENLTALRLDPGRREQLGRAARAAVEKYTWRSRAERALTGFL